LLKVNLKNDIKVIVLKTILREMVNLQKSKGQKVNLNIKDQKALIDIFGKLTFWKLTISPSILKNVTILGKRNGTNRQRVVRRGYVSPGLQGAVPRQAGLSGSQVLEPGLP
jgi:hypothetical protein